MNIPIDLWRALRIAAAEDGTDVTAIVERASRDYLQRRARRAAQREEK